MAGNTRTERRVRLEIEANGTGRLLVDDVDISHMAAAVRVTARVGQATKVEVELAGVSVVGDVVALLDAIPRTVAPPMGPPQQ